MAFLYTTLLSTLFLTTHVSARLFPWPSLRQVIDNGCGIPRDPGFHNDSDLYKLSSDNREREFGIYVPASYDPSKPTPLIFDFHGSGKTPWEQYDNSRYYADDAGKDYLVVYPRGVGDNWQGASYAAQGVNDLKFTQDLLWQLNTQYCLDRDHVYASGKSNGGGFVNTLACSGYGDDFAAFAMAAAALYTDTNSADCPYKRAILEVHGDDDNVIPSTGGQGRGGDLPDIDNWVSWWGDRNCGSGASATTATATATAAPSQPAVKGLIETTYSCSGWTDVVQHYAVKKMGHCWPSSTGENNDAQTSSDCGYRGLDFTGKVVEFFKQWDKAGAPSPN